MNIEQEIAAWDGKSADFIKQVYQSHHKQPGFTDSIVRLLSNAGYQKGASWLLKAYVESGSNLEQEQVKTISALLPELQHWETKLHILQSLPFIPVGETERISIEIFLRASLTDYNKFVRAWAYNGFYELAKQYPAYQEEVIQFLQMAMRDEAASVKARIRNIMKKGF
ncbi:MAG: hypothetical protein GY784_13450 [Gammaproteobacteria bacterium]|nr:hypothetical protein [Gammaproteobacteria bacterium]